MIKKIINTLFTKFFSAIAGFAILVLVSHILGTDGKGEQAIIAFNIYIITLVLNFVGNSTLIYFTPRKNFSSLVIPSWCWMVAISFLTSVVLFIIYGFENKFLWYALSISVIGALSEINYFILMGKEKVVQANGVKLLLSITNILILVFLVLIKQFDSIEDYILSLWLANIISLFYGLWLLKDEYKKIYLPSKNEMKESFKVLFSLGALKQLGTIAQTLNYRLSFYILAFFLGREAVGIYSNACSIGEAVMLFGTSLALVQYSSLSNKQSNKQSEKITIRLTEVNVAFTVSAMIVLCLLPESFWVFLFGEGFEQVSLMVRILALGITFLSCSSNFTQYFAAKGNFSISAFASFIGLIVTLILSFILIPRFGISGAGFAASLSYFTTFIIEFIYFLKWIRRN
ncbi:MAG: oligosaccharide flippase family protein [Bacteroidales bacterium]|nr:oligosaccharide flippase family protein [Bacteroidales bacterium]